MQVNGEQVTLDKAVSVADYLEQHGYRAERVAVELDGAIVPRDKRADVMLGDQSVMEIVQFVQGG
ncbi:sulfur carrier protein ThiS [Bifidobacterium callimiconis]|uniref:Thiamine biosynthesis protein ThiS n=1 Tax=Bifidobacterium callimiconis TaxID=2306973 RepID=A0A430FCS6_9BIFI|nr:sulfur carrier protein ThiS [Bifidobacterium callimiconis]MBT1176720.1 sulfur carrier protein ThiS [Bifidobacterium callimiconis]RSX50620.1 thiamine biosynthesis protein ThiS [Bifidobacterium callimiconis]